MRIDLNTAVSEPPAAQPGDNSDPTMAFLAALAQFLPRMTLATLEQAPASSPALGTPPTVSASFTPGSMSLSPSSILPTPLTPASLTEVTGLTVPIVTESEAVLTTQHPDTQAPAMTPAKQLLADVLAQTFVAEANPTLAAAAASASINELTVAAAQRGAIPALALPLDQRRVSPSLPDAASPAGSPKVVVSLPESPAQQVSALSQAIGPDGTVSAPEALARPGTQTTHTAGHASAPNTNVAKPDILALPPTAHAGPPDANGSVNDIGSGAPTPRNDGPVSGLAPALVLSTARPESVPAQVAPWPIAARPAPEVASQLAPYLATLRRGPDGAHHISVLLHPAELGQVQVVVELRAGTVNLTLSGAHEAARDALVGALPALRRELSEAGLTVGSTDVFAQDPGSSGAFSGGDPRAATQANPGAAPARAVLSTPELGPEPPPQLPRLTHAGAVDVTI